MSSELIVVYIADLDLASGLQVLQIQNHKYLGKFLMLVALIN